MSAIARPRARTLTLRPGATHPRWAALVLVVPHVWIGAALAFVALTERTAATLFGALLWNAGVSVLVVSLGVRPLLGWWLVARGRAQPGEITGVTPVGDGRVVRVRYRFPQREEHVVVAPSVAARVVVGQAVTVFTHPRWPRLHMVGELSAFEVSGLEPPALTTSVDGPERPR